MALAIHCLICNKRAGLGHHIYNSLFFLALEIDRYFSGMLNLTLIL